MIFEYSEYRAYLRDYLASQPKHGHGLLSQWARKLGVSTTLMSQILVGRKKLSLELAMGLSKILALTDKEMDHLFLLVEFDHAGGAELRGHFKKKIQRSQKASELLKNRIQDSKELPEEIKAHYYASWVYTGLRNLVACFPSLSFDEMAKRLNISREAAIEASEFMLKNGLLLKDEKGWKIGPKSTYLSSDSPLVRKHHQNWRIKSIQKMDELDETSLYYTSPMSLSEEMAKTLRKELVRVIEAIHAKAEPTSSETVRCLNIDWFEF